MNELTDEVLNNLIAQLVEAKVKERCRQDKSDNVARWSIYRTLHILSLYYKRNPVGDISTLLDQLGAAYIEHREIEYSQKFRHRKAAPKSLPEDQT